MAGPRASIRHVRLGEAVAHMQPSTALQDVFASGRLFSNLHLPLACFCATRRAWHTRPAQTPLVQAVESSPRHQL